ncbi:hypothetical protein [Paludisphaera mucosa]|uniref:Uncharacterized protein n=1 Tax=Paludisphaera mucosa TaxID=3030827 RepID=A0ABT6FLP2_9BACT|nr:hypothetical protein [Paludisphaera mucosa]MDG3008502.1 hypothetical protein [Paludisphaera mucosa]
MHLPGLTALAAVVAASGWIVWAVNAPFGWLAKALHVLAAGSVAFLVAGSIGVETIDIFVPLAVISMSVEGLILGGGRYGWPGALAGVVVGLLLSPFVALIATALVVVLTWTGSSPEPAEDRASVDEPS